MTPESFRAHQRAVETLDLGSTPHGDSSSTQTLRVLLLKEILDRIELPAEDEIPGEDEVAEESLGRWTIPDTPIVIEKVPDGPRAGEFLFSADTVARLERLYRQVRSLPYRSETQPGIYEDFLRSSRSWHVAASEVRNRLRPIDTASPLSTLEGFLESMNEAYALATEADAALEATPPGMTPEQALEIESKADHLIHRAVGALDLSKVPRSHRADVGVEAALKLKEILDRVPLPPLDAVPDADRVEMRDRGAGPFRWRIPNTDVEIVEITEGDRAGDFLFSASTVANLGRYYEELRDLPYRADDYAALAGEYRSSGRSEGFYVRFISTPGYLVARAHFLGRYLDSLPPFLLELHAGNTCWQWLGLGATVVVVGLAAWVVFRGVRRLARRLDPPWAHWAPLLAPAAVTPLVVVAVRFIDDDLNLTGDALFAVRMAGELIVLTMAAWSVFILLRALAEAAVASPRIPEESVDASLIRIAARVAAFLIGVWIVVAGVRGLGADVVPLLAGLGVGGLAVALAAQTTLANFIGSLILFATKPVRPGDFCRFGDEMGTVEQIGLHATRIRTLERSVVTVPNAEFSQLQLDNLSRRDQRLFRTVLQLRYETTPDQLRWLLAKLREMLLGHPEVGPDPARARLVGFGAYSKDVEIFAYARCRDQDEFLAIQEDLLLRVEDIVREAGSDFAFPSETSYVARDRGLNAERRGEAEAQVDRWRSDGELPFPEFDAEDRVRLTDVLDYPPEGSPGHRRHGGLSDASPDARPGHRPGPRPTPRSGKPRVA